ncbi:phenylalanine--tRNA ligase subunit beta [Anaerocolumna sp. AGMB13020]|uniref:phenylalanine--tRNA ligase subunit beta n=1 Tax=Anaerocolumna sp. AGMB13020 TaxID=3081750 RepID=UPI002952F054|nr:phenylalanine--tRNA ligase subunit beta [Anaerocolumna sp. AGMB13020]WOO38496.1 phenylalanine--tRNA ligase subunit beta [Anaerocolumna sp. AGMB13020]
MLISMNWISDYTDLTGINLKELINKFTLATAEVEHVYEMGTEIRSVVVGEIMSVKAHPGAEKLQLLKVNIGTEIIDCVCGAVNAAVGIYVPFARKGGRVGDRVINETVIAGESSYGMCCSEKELGISEDNSGLMILDKAHEPGTDILEFLPLRDVVFEVDNKSLTNRPDLWGHYGIAREISVLTKRPLKPLKVMDTEAFKELPPVPVTIEDKEQTFRYSAIRIENITKNHTPPQMKIRLTYCGVRSLNLLTDLTNYLMLEMGQPMHGFDNHIIQGIQVKTFPVPVDFETLDGVRRTVDTDTLMICTAQGEPAAIAGIMGGKSSGIGDHTTELLLEAANFDGTFIRKAAARLGLRTEASTRYEKTLDPEMTVTSIKRFLMLLREANPGIKVTSSLTDHYVKRYQDRTINFDKAYVDKYTGIDISVEEIIDTLSALGFAVKYKDKCFTAAVPSYRATKDVTIKADLIEEITRIYGYDNIKGKSNKSLISPIRHSVEREEEYRIKLLLADRFGMNEVHNYIWYDTKANKELGIQTKPNVRIINSVTAENDTVKATLIPSLLGNIYKNMDQIPEIAVFEIGRVAEGFDENSLCREKKKLGIAIASRSMTEKQTFLKLKEVIENLTDAIKNSVPVYLAYNTDQEIEGINYIHPVNAASIMMNEKNIGYFSCLHPKVKDRMDKKLNIAIAELDMVELTAIEKETIIYREISRYPGITIDLSLLTDKGIRYEELKTIISEFNCDYLKSYSLIDMFEDDTLLMGKKSVTIRFEFGSDERTLESKEISEITDRLLVLLGEKGIQLRG